MLEKNLAKSVVVIQNSSKFASKHKNEFENDEDQENSDTDKEESPTDKEESSTDKVADSHL